MNVKYENIYDKLNIVDIKYFKTIKEQNDSFYCNNLLFFFITEYAWFIIILFIVLIGFLFPYYHPSQKFYSKNPKEPWNSNSIPKIFFHISDIHISSYLGYKTNGSIDYLSDFLDYNPNLILISGDVVDNYEKKNFPKVGSQMKKDWDLYSNIIKKKFSKFKVIDVAGNHDLFAVDSLFSIHNNFLDYSFTYNRSNVKNEDDFIIKKINIFNETFILINEFIFPTPHPPYGVYPHHSKHLLDLLENAIETSGECIILNHYQIDRNWFIKSSKGHSYEQIVSKKNVKAIFSGHFHPSKTWIIHHGQGGIEFCAPPPFKGKAQGLITIDNNQLVYNSVLIKEKGEKPLCFMTYPIPKEQISSHHTFNYNESEIRIISYFRKEIDLIITGDINGKMKYQKRLENGADLYTYPINLGFGTYKIIVKGDRCHISREFIIGNEYEGKKELSICHLRGLLIMRLCFIPILIVIFIIIFPYGGNLKIAKDLEYYIEGKRNYQIKNFTLSENIFFIIKLIFLGPFIMRERYKLINLLSKLFLFIFSLYPFFFPIHFFKPFYGIYGFSFLFFIVIGNRIEFDEWVMQMTFCYYLAVILINAIYLAGLKYYENYTYGKYAFFINIFLSLAFWSGGIYINIAFIGESIEWPFLFFTPIFIIIPIVIKIIIHFKTYIDFFEELDSSNTSIQNKEENEYRVLL